MKHICAALLALLLATMPVASGTITAPGLVPGGPIGDSTVASPSLATRTVRSLWLERPSVVDYSVDMTGVADSSAQFAAALNSGKPITAPCGTIRLVSTVVVTAKAMFTGSGDCTALIYDAPAGSAAAPMVRVLQSAPGTTLDNFRFDQQNNTKNYAIPSGTFNTSALVIEADNVRLSRLSGANAHDNCIMFIRQDAGGAPVPGLPWYYSAKSIRTFNCGNAQQGAGAGLDVGSARWGTVDDLVDNGSYAAFIQDVGSAANGVFSNITGLNTNWNGTNESFTFYIGAGDSVYTNLRSANAKGRGLWLDQAATNVSLTNVTLQSSARTAALINSPNATVTNLLVSDPGTANGTADCIEISTGAGVIDHLLLINPVCRPGVYTVRTGIVKTGSASLTGAAINADITAATLTNVGATFRVTNALPITPYVVSQTFTNPWARVWSNGWKEQGGFVNGTGADQTVTFPVACSTSVTYVAGTITGAGSTATDRFSLAVDLVTATNFVARPRYTNSATAGIPSQSFYWTAQCY